MKRCSRCGKVMADRAQFCPVCGTRADTDAGRAEPAGAAAKPRRKKKRLTRAGMALALVVLLALAALAVLLITGAIGGSRGPKLQSYTPAETAAPAAEPEDGGAAEPQTVEGVAEMPALTGLSEAEALQKLAELGLAAETEEAGFDAAYPDGAVLTQSIEPGKMADAGEPVRLTVNRLPIALQAIWTGPRDGRLMVGNLIAVCKGMDTTNPNFTYTVEMGTNADPYVLTGGFRCLTGPNEPEPVSRLSGKLLKGKQNIGGVDSQMVAEDHAQWVFEIDDWTGFNEAYITSYKVTVASKANPEIQVSRSFTPEQAAGNVLMTQAFNGGRITVEAPSKERLILRLTDDKLQNGYTVSPMRGGGEPLWDIKLFQASYKWIDVQVDGRNCPSIDAMNLITTHLFEEQSSKSMTAAPFSGASYAVEGNSLVITLNLPTEAGHDPYGMNWLELTLGGTVFKMKMK